MIHSEVEMEKIQEEEDSSVLLESVHCDLVIMSLKGGDPTSNCFKQSF